MGGGLQRAKTRADPGLNSLCPSRDGYSLVQEMESLVGGDGEGPRVENGYQLGSPRRQAIGLRLMERECGGGGWPGNGLIPAERLEEGTA